MYEISEEILFSEKTTHLVISFLQKNINGKTMIDIVPINWIYKSRNEHYTLYPDRNEYQELEKMVQTSSAPKKKWKSFKILVLKESESYDQAKRRMQRAFTDSIIQTSTHEIDNNDSSEDEEDPLELTQADVENALKNVPKWGTNTFITTSANNKSEGDAALILSDFDKSTLKDNESSSAGEETTSLIPPKKSQTKKNLKRKIRTSLDTSSSESPSPKQPRKKPVSKKNINCSINSVNITSSESNDEIFIEKNRPKPDFSIKRSHKSLRDEILDLKTSVKSIKRSIEYRIQDEARKTRELFAKVTGHTQMGMIVAMSSVAGLPKTQVDAFQQFDKELITDEDLRKRFKCMMTIYTTKHKVSENLTDLIPKVITKDVQIMYSGCGKETKGRQKLNFSATETYKCLLEVYAVKFPDITNAEIKTVLSRWFSGAGDREGGRAERERKKNSRS